MANVLARVANARGVHDYRESVHTPDFPTASWIVNPNLSALVTVPKRYLKPTGIGDGVREMTAVEKAAGPDLRIAPGGPTIESPDLSTWELLVSNLGVVTARKI
jgi:hypothetical protein